MAVSSSTSLRTMMLLLILLIHFVVSAVSSSNPASSNTPRGLVNLGNTCYLNSQLQCAYSIPKVRELLITSSSDENDDGAEQSSPRKTLGELFTDMMQRPSSSIAAPRAFCRALGIPVHEQQDAQEFWKLLLPTLSIPPLLNLYRGELETYIRACDESGREKRRRETYLDLSLDILADNVRNVEEAIVQTYLTPERLSVAERNGWRPAKGELPVDAIKGATLLIGPSQLPSILQLHLKRFQYDWQTGTMSKVNKRLPFPLELQLPVESAAAAVTTSSSSNDDLPTNTTIHCRYVLQAVVVHAGEYGAGHYYAYVRPHPSSDAWFRCDDERIEAVSWEEVARDAFGGKYEEEPAAAAIIADQEAPPPPILVGGQLEQQQQSQRSRRSGNPLVRFLCSLLHQLGLWIKTGGGRSAGNDKNPYGFGGPTSSAYVLQYVRRCQIDVLFGA